MPRIPARQFTYRFNKLGSNSEVDGFRIRLTSPQSSNGTNICPAMLTSAFGGDCKPLLDQRNPASIQNIPRQHIKESRLRQKALRRLSQIISNGLRRFDNFLNHVFPPFKDSHEVFQIMARLVMGAAALSVINSPSVTPPTKTISPRKGASFLTASSSNGKFGSPQSAATVDGAGGLRCPSMRSRPFPATGSLNTRTRMGKTPALDFSRTIRHNSRDSVARIHHESISFFIYRIQNRFLASAIKPIDYLYAKSDA